MWLVTDAGRMTKRNIPAVMIISLWSNEAVVWLCFVMIIHWRAILILSTFLKQIYTNPKDPEVRGESCKPQTVQTEFFHFMFKSARIHLISCLDNDANQIYKFPLVSLLHLSFASFNVGHFTLFPPSFRQFFFLPKPLIIFVH